MEPLEISPEELKARLKEKPEIILLDVRDPEEVNETPGLPGAVCIPMGDVPGRTHELDPESEIAAYCARGRRSTWIGKATLRSTSTGWIGTSTVTQALSARW